MKKTKKFSKLLALALAVVMMMGMAVTASAYTGVVGTGSALEKVDVTVTVKTDGNTYQPNTTFSLSVENGEAGTFDGQKVYAGETGGLNVGTAASFAYTDASSLSVSDSYSTEATLTFDTTKFSHTGIYSYVVKEADNTYEGVTVDSTSYNVYLYVYESAESAGTYYVGYVVSTVRTTVGGVTTETKTDLSFENDYGYKDNPDPSDPSSTDGSSTHDITISKVINGDMADASKTFTFTVKVTSADQSITEAYKIMVKESSTASVSTTQTYMTSGSSGVEVKLKGTGSIQIFGLSENDIVSIEENDYSSTDGYTTDITSVTNVKDSNSNLPLSITSGGTTRSANVKLTADGAAVTFTNTKKSTTPTGVILTYSPYAAMVVIALGACVVFFRRRRSTMD